MRFKDHLIENENKLYEASANQAIERMEILHDIIMNTDDIKEKIKDSGMKTQKEAAKIFQQAISLLKGLK